MINRFVCHCEAMINIDSDVDDDYGWLFYESMTENGIRKFGLCPRCQAAFKCYLDNNPIKPVSDIEQPVRKRGRPPKNKEE